MPRVLDAVRRGQTDGVAGMRIGVVKQLRGEGYQAGVLESFDAAVATLAAGGAEIVEVDCPHFQYALAAYYLILPSECSSNLARFDAMRYGLRVGDDGTASAEEVMSLTRGRGFGAEVKRRIILGTYALSAGYYDAYYGSAQKVRTLIKQDFENAFTAADVLISPASPVTAFPIGEKVERPDGDVRQRPGHHPRVARRDPGDERAQRHRLGHRPAGRPADHGSGARRGADLPRRGRFRNGLRRSTFRAGPGLRTGIGGGCPMTASAAATGALRAPAGLMDFDEAMELFDPVLGLEVHVELGTATKMFCACPTDFGAPPNTQVCPVCLALPGAMPTINATAVEYAIRIGLALNCTIASWCRFARKNYFYPDMPKNFQTSQYDEPIAYDGYLDVDVDGETVRIEIERAHMEEDTGKSTHVGGCHRPDLRRRVLAAGLQPGRRAAGRDRHQDRAGHQGQGAGGGQGLRGGAAGPAEVPRRLRRPDGPGVAAVRREPVADAGRQPGPRHPHRDQERQLAALGGTRRPVRDHPAGSNSRRRWPDQAGDQALRRVDRDDRVRPVQGDRRGLPVFPGARPGSAGTGAGVGGADPRRRCRSSRGCAGPGCRRRGASPTRRCGTWSPPTRWNWSPPPSRPGRRRPRRGPGGRPTWVSRRTPGRDAGGAADHPGPAGRRHRQGRRPAR